MSWLGRPLQIYPTMQDCAELIHATLTRLDSQRQSLRDFIEADARAPYSYVYFQNKYFSIAASSRSASSSLNT